MTEKTTETKLLLHAVASLREALAIVTEHMRVNPPTTGIAIKMQQALDSADFATAAVAGLTGGSIIPGSGSAPDVQIAAAAKRWIERGKRDAIAA
jgi:hypothetical protein